MARNDILVPIAVFGLGAVLLAMYFRSNGTQPEYGTDTAFDTGTPQAPMSASTYFRPTVPYMQFDPKTMNTSAAGLQNIITWEGKSNKAYLDNGKPAIGIGHDIVPGDGLDMNSVITDATMNAIFANDIDNAEQIVKGAIGVPLTQGQFDALVDFAFQFGSKLGKSTLAGRLNAGDYAGAQFEFGKWINEHDAAGNLVQNPQLVQRRAAAAAMFA